MRYAVIALLVVAVAATIGFFLRDDSGDSLDFDAVTVEIVELRPNVHLLQSVAGTLDAGNMVVQHGSDGVLAVDTQYHQLGEKLLTAIRTFTSEPVRYVINTHAHIDHVGGNEIISLNGQVGAASGQAGSPIAAPVLAHANVLSRLQEPPPVGRREGIWPTETYDGESVQIVFNGEVVDVIYQPSAHTNGDSIVHFTGSGVISAGDIFNARHYPFINREFGGSLRGILASLQTIADLARESGAIVVPGHGPVADADGIVAYRDMLITIRDRVAAMIGEGMTLPQILRARPSAEFDSRYGREAGFWTTEEFIDAVHFELTRPESTEQ